MGPRFLGSLMKISQLNDYGLFTLVIGSVNTSQFQAIEWGEDRYFISIEIDGNPIGPGGQEFQAVPYSKVSEKAVNMEINELNNVNATAPIIGQVLKWNGSTWAPGNDAVDSTTSLIAGDGLEIHF